MRYGHLFGTTATLLTLACADSSQTVVDDGPGIDVIVPDTTVGFGGEDTTPGPSADIGPSIDTPPTDAGTEDIPPTGTPALVINEVHVGDGSGTNDWVELFNAGDGNAALAGWSLGRPTGVKTVLPAASVAPGGYFIVEANLAFTLLHTDTVRLNDPQGGVAGETSWVAGNAAPGSSWGRFPNAVGPFKTLAKVTKGAENVDEGTPPCGDATCAVPETCESCPQDCGACPICGDGECNGDEDCTACDIDCGKCPTCPNGTCAADESCLTCEEDCGACPEGCSPALFFGAYVEGTSQDKALEIVNYTGAAVDLSHYAIWRISNGGSWTEGKANDVPLEGILPHGESLVLCNSSAGGAIQGVCDQPGGSATSFNGDDAIGLARDGELVDTIGDESDPAPEGGWTVAGVSEATTDHTLIRKPTVIQGSLEWAIASTSEWQVLEVGKLGSLGDHVVTGNCEPVLVTPDVAINEVGVGFGTFVELINRDPLNPVDISGWTLTATPVTYKFDPGSIVPPGGITSVAGVALGGGLSAGGASIVLTNADGTEVDQTTPPVEQLETEGFGRIPDGNGAFKRLDTPTPGLPNVDNVTLCGDGDCEANESCSSCAKDCGACPKCGDGTCNGSDDCSSCPGDCGQCADCEDALCAQSESCATCVADCGECLPGCATDLLISEYVEALSSNKALEIANRTDKPVDLAGYSIWRITNGGTWETEGKDNAYPLTGILLPGKTWVICDNGADPGLLAKCDVTTGGVPTTFNGNDAVALVKGSEIIDVVGTDGEDPGAGWEVGGVKDATADHVLRRKLTVNAPNADWATSAAKEWIVLPTVAFDDDLGNHPLADGCTPLPPCADGWCDAANETCESCPADCGACPETCGNNFCAADTEDCQTCEDDCGVCPEICGDDLCVGAETCENCAEDCGVCPEPCGNLQCLEAETCVSCPGDCGICPAVCSPTLFFSEYIEGTNNNKALEIVNNTGDTVDLSEYSFDVGFNGNAVSSTGATALAGTLVNGDTYVLCNDNAFATLVAACDQPFAGSPLTFNGNDAIALYKGTVLVDVIGTPGQDPGLGWDIAGVTAATNDHRLVRKSSVSAGVMDWAAGVEQWLVESASVFDTIGEHTFDGPCVVVPPN